MDEVVWYLGRYVESELAIARQSTGKADNDKLRESRVENRLRKLLGIEQKFAPLG